MKPKSLDDLEEENPELAAHYRDALDEISHWVTDQVAAGNAEVFSEVPGELVRIQHRRGLPDEVWDYLDWEDLYFAAIG